MTNAISNPPVPVGLSSTNLTFLRIIRCAEIVRYWDFFARGFTFLSAYLHYPYTLDLYRRIILKLAKTPSAFVGVVLDDTGSPVCFGAAFDCTPLFATHKEYEIPFLYHQPAHLSATALLRTEFEKFCRREKVKRYYMTTTAFNGAAQKCFPRYGFHRSHVVFKRELK